MQGDSGRAPALVDRMKASGPGSYPIAFPAKGITGKSVPSHKRCQYQYQPSVIGRELDDLILLLTLRG